MHYPGAFPFDGWRQLLNRLLQRAHALAGGLVSVGDPALQRLEDPINGGTGNFSLQLRDFAFQPDGSQLEPSVLILELFDTDAEGAGSCFSVARAAAALTGSPASARLMSALEARAPFVGSRRDLPSPPVRFPTVKPFTVDLRTLPTVGALKLVSAAMARSDFSGFHSISGFRYLRRSSAVKCRR